MADNRNHTTHDPLDDTAAAALDSPADQGTELERERDQLKDRLLRTAAEFDNFRKRTERDRQALSESITAGVLEDLLPLVDDLERAVKAEASSEGGGWNGSRAPTSGVSIDTVARSTPPRRRRITLNRIL